MNLRDWQKKASERRDEEIFRILKRYYKGVPEHYKDDDGETTYGIGYEIGYKVGYNSCDAEIDLLLQIIEKQSEALQSLAGYQEMNNYPEHEVRFELCCAIPQLYLDTQSEVEKLIKQLGGDE